MKLELLHKIKEGNVKYIDVKFWSFFKLYILSWLLLSAMGLVITIVFIGILAYFGILAPKVP